MLTIYHNARCSKSRQTLQLIEDANQAVTVIEYLKTPLTEHEIKALLTKLNIPAIEMMRTNEAEFKAQNLKEADEVQLINAMVNTPKLIERPIVTKDEKAIIGRPPENVLTLLP
jgi:arsenate reductase